ncbi:MAG: hypothetical protein HZY76_09090 [Anaerolineae bacterium]|nr:MAG: hypothetical protein HZY76_09090 [Anaerolineae bacterium]
MIPLAAGLDARFGPPAGFSLAVELAALALLVGGYVLASYALIENAYFSGMVRIQTDRGQQVVSSGPYRWVRHPGYAGALLAYLATPFLLASLWALLPAFLLAVVLVIRTRLEDQTLHTERSCAMNRLRPTPALRFVLLTVALVIVAALAGYRSRPAAARPRQRTAPTLRETVSLNGLRGWSAALDNHLKIFDVALDESRNRIYVQGILTPGIAVIDGASDTLIGNLDSGGDDNDFNRPYLAVHPTTGALYLAGFNSRTLRRIDPTTNTITAQASLTADPCDVIIDPATNRVFVSLQAAGKVAVFDANTLAPVGMVNLGSDRIGGMALDSAARRLYVVYSGAPTAATPIYVIDPATLAVRPR